ncbi:FMN-binding negative transcriptional regulator, partial [Bordetella bronchiseptica]|uniref:FMN-binding negative transcriptional regulator n=1 Tax=Bordetella bronchiseptica TaxID=518 RepID=UPI0022869EBA
MFWLVKRREERSRKPPAQAGPGRRASVSAARREIGKQGASVGRGRRTGRRNQFIGWLRCQSLRAWMRDWSFATLVTHGDQGLQATHLPFLLDPLRGPHGTLISHLARRNPQAADIQA